MSIELPAIPRLVNGVDALIVHINDRLRRISLNLGPGAPGEAGAAGAPGPPGPGAGPDESYTVPISGGIATPDASKANNLLIEMVDTLVGNPIGVPAAGTVALWNLTIVQGVGGTSTSFTPSYKFDLTATDADSPLASSVTLSLSTDSAGDTLLVSFGEAPA